MIPVKAQRVFGCILRARESARWRGGFNARTSQEQDSNKTGIRQAYERNFIDQPGSPKSLDLKSVRAYLKEFLSDDLVIDLPKIAQQLLVKFDYRALSIQQDPACLPAPYGPMTARPLLLERWPWPRHWRCEQISL